MHNFEGPACETLELIPFVRVWKPPCLEGNVPFVASINNTKGKQSILLPGEEHLDQPKAHRNVHQIVA